MIARTPPESADELRRRAEALTGRTLDEIAEALGTRIGKDGVRTKGKVGELIERALGASAGSAAIHDFPHLRIELKTIPVDAGGRPRESTFVCSIALQDADRAEWSTSWVRSKLGHVLWVPVVTPEPGGVMTERVIGTPLFWQPTAEQERVLQGDFDDVMGAIGIGGIEGVTAYAGRWLQVRPKAQNSHARTMAYGAEGERIATVPRGFYLRARFTQAILRDPAALPE